MYGKARASKDSMTIFIFNILIFKSKFTTCAFTGLTLGRCPG
jgi:hypothetical protein